VTNKIVTVAIAGQGRSGYKIHADWLRHATDRFRIVAVADPLPERRRELEQEFGARGYAGWQELVAARDAEVLINATPTPMHVPATIAALEAGWHVLCEKPMAPNLAEFDRMVETARRAGRILAPFQNNRYQPFFVELLRIVRSGILGELVEVRSLWGGFGRRWDWQTFQCNYGGCLFNTGPHAVDQALQFFAPDATPAVSAVLQCHNLLGGDADDYCAVVLTAPGAPRVELIITQYEGFPAKDMYVVNGTRGSLTGNWDALRWKYYDWDQAPPQPVWRPWSLDRNYPNEKLPWQEGVWRLDQNTAGNAVGYTLRSFAQGVGYIYDGLYQALTGTGTLTVTLPEVRRQIAVIEECHRQNPLPRKVDRWP